MARNKFYLLTYLPCNIYQFSRCLTDFGWAVTNLTDCLLSQRSQNFINFIHHSSSLGSQASDRQIHKPTQIHNHRQRWIGIAPRRERTSNKALRYGTRSQGISQFYLHTQRSLREWRVTGICRTGKRQTGKWRITPIRSHITLPRIYSANSLIIAVNWVTVCDRRCLSGSAPSCLILYVCTNSNNYK